MKLTGRWFPQIVDGDSGNLYPAGADPGGGGGLSESLGIDFYSGFRKKSSYTLLWWIQRKKPQKGGGGVQFKILRNPGIDFYSGFKKKSRYTLL